MDRDIAFFLCGVFTGLPFWLTLYYVFRLIQFFRHRNDPPYPPIAGRVGPKRRR